MKLALARMKSPEETNYPLTEQIAYIRRELALRQSVCYRRVQSGRMKQAHADREVGCMQAVHDTLQTLHDSLTKMQEKLGDEEPILRGVVGGTEPVDKLRSAFDQRAGLLLLQAKVPGSLLRYRAGDVVSLIQGDKEICFAYGGYDLWVKGHLSRPDLTLDEAVMALTEKP